MAKFRISARPATFYAAGEHKMVSVSAMAAPLVSRVVECKNVHDLGMCILATFWEVRREYPEASFSMHQRLIEGRAPARYRGKYFGMDYDASDSQTSAAA